MKATKVKNAYMKKKDPLFVRESLLNAAFELAATKGMAECYRQQRERIGGRYQGGFL